MSRQQGTTVINIGHLDERHYVSEFQLDYYYDRISGYEISCATNVKNNYYSEVKINKLTMAEDDVRVSNNNYYYYFSKAEAKRAYMRESLRLKRLNKEFSEKEINAKCQKRSENIEAARKCIKQIFHKHKTSNPKYIREVNRKAQSNVRKAMQNSILNQTEIPQGQYSIRHCMSKASDSVFL